MLYADNDSQVLAHAWVPESTGYCWLYSVDGSGVTYLCIVCSGLLIAARPKVSGYECSESILLLKVFCCVQTISEDAGMRH